MLGRCSNSEIFGCKLLRDIERFRPMKDQGAMGTQS